jgi:hypothetical protein
MWAVNVSSAGAGASAQLELSINSARQVATNDATGIISVRSMSYYLTTSGATSHDGGFYHPCDCQFEDGDKLYLHATEAGGATFATRCLLYFA